MTRLSLSDADKQARDWFAKTTESLGCKVTVDEMGNQFAIRPGKNPGPPTCAGSHLDTQPTGGRYDGILGVTAGVEMLRMLEENRHQTEYPVGVINWTNEEGARFPISMVSSGVWADSIPLSHAHSLPSISALDPPHTTMKSELQRISYLGPTPCSHESMPLAAHFELHIEQGPILERSAQKIGVVRGVQSYKWFTITVRGRDCHTGTTDFFSRSDALVTAARCVLRARDVAVDEGGLASTGVVNAAPGSTNTVPGLVKFSLDIRGATDDVVERIESRLQKDFEDIAADRLMAFRRDENAPKNVTELEWRVDTVSPAIRFDESCIECVQGAARDVFGDEAARLTRDMVSGAGHDSVYTSKWCPTSMVFVPSRDGISHNPREFTEAGDCALGAQVLAGAVLRFDALRAQRGG